MIAKNVEQNRDADQAQSHRDAAALRSRQRYSAVASIGDLPQVANPGRREACSRNLELFLTTYFPNSTGLRPFSEDHQRVIGRMMRGCLDGGRIINAVYRGFAKTTIAENTALWATLNGHRQFVPIFGATGGHAKRNVTSIKQELQSNELLAADYPEICQSIIAIGGAPQRTHSQHYNGELTNIEWTGEFVVLPSIRLDPDLAKSLHIPIRENGYTLGSGAILTAHGLTAASRGLRYVKKDGTKPRPDFVIIDDPQTDEIARSPGQIEGVIGLITKAILMLAGPRSNLAVVMNGTVIEADDVIDRMLDRTRYPSWNGERIGMVKSWSTAHESFWLGDYAKARNSFDVLIEDDQLRARDEATELYLKRREEADAGAQVSWEWCYDEETEASAIQHAYNVLLDCGEEAFEAECQNRPRKKLATGSVEIVPASVICSRINGRERRCVPSWAQQITSFVDVQKSSLWYVVCAFNADFTGAVLDYGCYPDQGRSYFSLSDIRKTIQRAHPGMGWEAALMVALEKLHDELLGAIWKREDGAEMRIGKAIIDSAWGESTAAINEFCRQSRFAAALLPSHGLGITAGKKPMHDYEDRPGEHAGLNWRIRQRAQGRSLFVQYDTNFWKTFVQGRLSTAIGDAGNLTLFGVKDRDEHAHRMFADHCTSEYRVRTSGYGREVDEWKISINKSDNHWWDGLVGCHVAASVLGCAPPGMSGQAKRKRLKLSELYANKYGRRAG